MNSSVIEENLGLVYAVAKRFTGRNVEYEDLVQIGSIGLIKASENFDESLGYKFSTYAVPMIMGEIKRYLRDDGIIKVSRTIKENAGKIGYAKEKLTKQLGRTPTISEISKESGVSEEDIVIATDATQAPESIYSTINDDSYLIDYLKTTENEEDATVNRIFLKELLDSLDKRSRKVILLRYFKEETQQQIAEKLGVSQVQVSRIEKKILKELKARCREEF